MTEKLGGYIEWFGLFPSSADSEKPQYYFNGGIIYQFTNDVQWDIRSGVGLNEAADDYFDYVREFRHYTEKDAVWHEQLTIHFTCSPPDSLGVKPVKLFSKDQSTYEQFFSLVEGQPEFLQGLAFGHWSVELRLDGC